MPPSSPSEELREQPTHHLLEPRSGAAQAPWLEPQAHRMLSVHREQVPRTATHPSSPQVERRRQQTHLSCERRSTGPVAGAPGAADALRASQQSTGGVVQAAVASVAQASQQRWSSRSSGCTRETSPFSRSPGWDLSGHPSAACVAAVHRMQESFSNTRMEMLRMWRSSTPTMPSFT